MSQFSNNKTKDFDRWNGVKKSVHGKSDFVFFHEREIWFCHMGLNVGFEQDGKGANFGRPLIIFRKFNNHVFWGVPLTTKNKKGKFYLPLVSKDAIMRMAILSQLRLFDGIRLYQKIGVIDKEEHKKLERRIVQLCTSV